VPGTALAGRKKQLSSVICIKESMVIKSPGRALDIWGFARAVTSTLGLASQPACSLANTARLDFLGAT
jgi:hypothetical protein